MRRNLIGVLVVLVIAGAFLAVRLGGRHEARSVLEQSLASLPPGYTATHGATDYDAITDTFTVHDFVLRHDGLKVAGAGVAVVSGAHPQALQAVFDPASYPDGKPAWTDRRPLLGHVDLTALELYPPTPGAAPLKIRHVVLGVAERPPIHSPAHRREPQRDRLSDRRRPGPFGKVPGGRGPGLFRSRPGPFQHRERDPVRLRRRPAGQFYGPEYRPERHRQPPRCFLQPGQALTIPA